MSGWLVSGRCVGVWLKETRWVIWCVPLQIIVLCLSLFYSTLTVNHPFNLYCNTCCIALLTMLSDWNMDCVIIHHYSYDLPIYLLCSCAKLNWLSCIQAGCYKDIKPPTIGSFMVVQIHMKSENPDLQEHYHEVTLKTLLSQLTTWERACLLRSWLYKSIKIKIDVRFAHLSHPITVPSVNTLNTL